MIAVSEEFYQNLKLPYRVMAIVSGALNNAAAKKYDLEAWFPFQGEYKELVSVSNCTDYQSRELEIRLGQKTTIGTRKTYVHALNGTLCAAERTLCCVLENYQTEDVSVLLSGGNRSSQLTWVRVSWCQNLSGSTFREPLSFFHTLRNFPRTQPQREQRASRPEVLQNHNPKIQLRRRTKCRSSSYDVTVKLSERLVTLVRGTGTREFRWPRRRIDAELNQRHIVRGKLRSVLSM